MAYHGSRPERAAFEAPTAWLALAVYGLWFALTYFYDSLPLGALIALGAWTIAWQLSLQHETVHGHPSRMLWLNTLIGTWPLALWRPYELYSRSHLAHHFEPSPDDPETSGFRTAHWARLSPLERAVLRAESTLLGRLVLGPAGEAYRFGRYAMRRVAAGERRVGWMLARHTLEAALVLYWVVGICDMPLWLYGLIAYMGSALELLGQFAEHRAESGATPRAGTVERAPLLGVLFLNSNLHGAHHLDLSAPWYRLPEIHRRYRKTILARNGGLVYRSYFDVFRRFLTRPLDAPSRFFRGVSRLGD